MKNILIIAALFLLACKKTGYEDAALFSFRDIPETTMLKGEILDVEEIYRPLRLYIRDTVMFVVNSNMEYIITAYNLKTLRKTGEYLTFGSGPEDILSIENIQFSDTAVWVFDMSGQKILQYDINNFLSSDKKAAKNVIKLETGCSNALIVDDKIFAYSLSNMESRFTVFNMDGKIIGTASKLPDTGEELTDLEKYESFFFKYTLNPSNNHIYMTYMNTDLIEIYDSTGTLLKRIHGPEQFFPAFQQRKLEGDALRVSSIQGKTRDAYYNPQIHKDNLWCLYSGKVFDSSADDGFLQNRIIVFDKEGVPMRQYTTDIPFYAMAIDGNDNYIYGVTMHPDFMIVRYKF